VYGAQLLDGAAGASGVQPDGTEDLSVVSDDWDGDGLNSWPEPVKSFETLGRCI
jgi:hypothetical protein